MSDRPTAQGSAGLARLTHSAPGAAASGGPTTAPSRPHLGRLPAGRVASVAVKLVALTGGIGSGKSSVSERLSARGALIIDADEIVRQLQQPGGAVFTAMVERWGERIVGPDGNLDRPTVAGIVFGDKAELDALNSMIHPAVRREMHHQADALSAQTGVVIFDIPLLAEGGPNDRRGASVVAVVDIPVVLAVERLMAYRGFTREDAEARMAAQATREDRLAMSDFVIDNSGDLPHLDAEVERFWRFMDSQTQTPWPPPRRPKPAAS
jgi:dephospho-CoA kinase